MSERRSIEFSDIAATKLLVLERKYEVAPAGILLTGERTVSIDRHGRVTWLDRTTEQREAELVEALDTLVNCKWSIASPIQARPDNYEAATHLMCSVEKQVIDNARALLAKHEATSEEERSDD